MTKKKNPKKKGRRGKYYTNVQPRLIEIEGWCREGLIDEQIWPRLSISKTSFYDYQNQHSEFLDALKNGKNIVDYRVENSLLKSAEGHEKIIKKAFKLKKVWYDENGKRCEEETIAYADEIFYYPPVPVSMIYWLKNRKPNQWKDKPDTKKDVAPVTIINALPGAEKIGGKK